MNTLNTFFDQEQLLRLLTNLYIFTGMAANILAPQGRDINLFEGHPPFCKALNALPEGHRRCVACDAWKIKHYNAAKGLQFCRCHAGVCEAVMPPYDKSCPLAYLTSGGETLFQLIARRRIEAAKAKELLVRNDLPVAAVAEGRQICYNNCCKSTLCAGVALISRTERFSLSRNN